MSRLVAVYGDDTQLEEALNALQDAGLADKMRVIGGGTAPGAADEAAADRAADRAGDGRAADVPGADPALTDPPPAVVPGTGGTPPISPAVLDPLAVPPGGSSAVGVVGPDPGVADTPRELERITGGDADETHFYTEALEGGASLLVVEGDDRELDRAEVALEGNAGQGMVRR